MKILFARKNKDSEWVQIATNLQQNLSSEEASRIVKRYRDGGWELGWSEAVKPFVNWDDDNFEWNTIEDSQNKNLLGC